MPNKQGRTGSVDTIAFYLCVSLALGIMAAAYFLPKEHLSRFGGNLINWVAQ